MDIKNTYLGFTDTMKPMLKTRMEKILDNVKRYDGVILSNKQFIYNQLKEGNTLEIKENVVYWSKKKQDYTNPKTEYRIRSQEDCGLYYVIEKTLYNFANYILNNNLLNDGTAKEFIISEQEKIKLEEQVKLKQEEEKNKQEQNIINFEKWLVDQASGYNNNEKLKLLKEIFFAETGQFGGGSIRLLVLIDNFDDIMCKNKLKSWLGYYNTASLKTFFHLTGINLGKTNKQIQAKLDIITSKDFTGIIPFKLRKQKTDKEQELFYTYSFNSDTNQYEFQECYGEYVKKYNLDFFISKTKNGYNITEGTSGLSAAVGKNKRELFETLENNINKMGLDEMYKRIEQFIHDKGVSPKYQNVAIA